MANAIALSKIEHGFMDKNGKSLTLVFKEGDKVEGLPDDVMASLLEAKAIKMTPSFSEKVTSVLEKT